MKTNDPRDAVCADPVGRRVDRCEAPEPVSPPGIPPASPERAAGEGPDYSIYEPWDKTSEDTRTLFHELEKLVKSLGSVRRDVFKSEISFKCTAAHATSPR